MFRKSNTPEQRFDLAGDHQSLLIPSNRFNLLHHISTKKAMHAAALRSLWRRSSLRTPARGAASLGCSKRKRRTQTIATNLLRNRYVPILSTHSPCSLSSSCFSTFIVDDGDDDDYEDDEDDEEEEEEEEEEDDEEEEEDDEEEVDDEEEEEEDEDNSATAAATAAAAAAAAAAARPPSYNNEIPRLVVGFGHHMMTAKKMKDEKYPRTALITGGTSGMGAALARA